MVFVLIPVCIADIKITMYAHLVYKGNEEIGIP